MNENIEKNYFTLEELIKQQKEILPHTKALVSVLYLSNRIENCLDFLFTQYDLTHQQYNVLRILRGAGEKGMFINEVKERMLDLNSDTSRLLDRLEFRNFVTKEKVNGDKRKTLIRITEKAIVVLSLIDKEEELTFVEFFEGIDKDDLAKFTKCAEIAINNIIRKKKAINPSL